jgi:hypothetical protein
VRRRTVLIASIAAALVLVPMGPAMALDPDTTLVVNEGDSAYGKPLSLVAAAPGGIVYQDRSRDSEGGLLVRPTGAAASQLLGWNADQVFASGALIAAQVFDGAGSDIRTRPFEGGTDTIIAARTGEGLIGATPSGVVLQRFVNSGYNYNYNGYNYNGYEYNDNGYDTNGYEYNYNGYDYNYNYNCNAYSSSCGPRRVLTLVDVDGTRTPLKLPNRLARATSVLVGPTGVAVVAPLTRTSSGVWFSTYAQPGTWRKIYQADTLAWDVDLMDINGSRLLVAARGFLTAQPLDGDSIDPERYPAGATFGRAAMTGTSIVFSTCRRPAEVYVKPINGFGSGDWRPVQGDVAQYLTCSSGFAGDGERVLAATDQLRTPAARAGIYAVIDGVDEPQPVALVGPKTLEAGAIGVGAGRVVWTDDSAEGGPLWQRSLTGGGPSVALGAKSLIAGNATSYGLGISGRRTTFLAEAPAGSPRFSQRLVTRGEAERDLDASAISGLKASTPGAIVDLVTGERSELAADEFAYGLWGDSVLVGAGSPNDGLRVRSLTSGEESVVVPSGNAFIEQVAIGPDHVAWMAWSYEQVDPDCDPAETYCEWDVRYGLKTRNYREPSPIRTYSLGDTYVTGLAVTEQQVLVTGVDCGPDSCSTVVRGADTAGGPVSTLATVRADPFEVAVDGTTVAWIDAETRLPKVTSLSVDSTTPRAVGPAVSPGTLDAAGGESWNAEWVFTKPLPDCTIQISRSSVPVRSFDCATEDGSALATWDGKNAQGKLVRSGIYDWTLTGADTQGAVRRTDGGAGPLTGVIDVVGAPVTTPDAPEAVSAVAGDASAVVSWSEPGSDGGDPISGYTVTSSPGDKTCTSSGALTCEVPGLVNGTSYTFSVTATNGVGTSVPSAPSAAVTPARAPDAPTGLTLVGGLRTASVSWTAPTDSGGSPITGYTVTASPGGASCSTTGLSCTLTGLPRRQDVTVSVVATNALGDSAAATAVLKATAVTLARSIGTNLFGGAARVNGSVQTLDGTPVIGASVRIESRKVGTNSWTTVRTVTTNGAGVFTADVRPIAKREFRAVFGGGTGLQGRFSPVVRLDGR